MLETIGKKLKKNNVSLDIVDFGEEEDGKPEKLEALFAAVNSNDSSHIVHIPPGGTAISDALMKYDTLASFFTSRGYSYKCANLLLFPYQNDSEYTDLKR
jgi:hypothetical protein